MKNLIAHPNWKACQTCKNHNENGCKIKEIEIFLYHGEWILCEDYEEKEDGKEKENS